MACLGVVSPTVGQPRLPNPTDMATSQSDLDNSFLEAFLSDEFQLCQADISG